MAKEGGVMSEKMLELKAIHDKDTVNFSRFVFTERPEKGRGRIYLSKRLGIPGEIHIIKKASKESGIG